MNKLIQLMGARALTSAIQSPAGGLPTNLPPGFFTKTRPVPGNIAQWRVYPNSRSVPALNTYGGASVHREVKGASNRAAIMLHSFENQTFGQDVFNQIASVDGGLDELGRVELTRQTADFKRRFMNLRTAAIHSVLALGKIYKAGTSMLPSSSGATETIDLGVPAANLGNCNGIIGTKWDQSTATVLTDVEELQSAASKYGNAPLRYAFYGNGVAEALINNPTIAKLIQGGRLGSFDTGKVPDALQMQWVPLGSMFFEDESGTQTDMFSKLCVFTPDPKEGDWYEMQEGSYTVPTGGGGMPTDAVEALSQLTGIHGMFSYARLQMDPPAIQQFAGDTFLPCLKVPSAIFSATVLT